MRLENEEENEWFFLQSKNSFTFHAQKDDILDPPLEIEQGHFRIPEEQSLGTEINGKELRRYQA